jgi:TPR repeat protein
MKQYKNGNRDASFLFDYCYILRDAYELSTTEIHEYISTQSSNDLHSENNIRFIYEFAFHGHDIAIPLGSTAYQFMFEYVDEFKTYFEEEQIVSRLVWIAHHAANKAIEELDESTFYQALEVINKFDKGKAVLYKEMDGRTTGVIFEKNLPLRLQMAFVKGKGDRRQYRELSGQYIQRIWDHANQLNELAWEYYQEKEDKDDLKEAISWVKRSIELENSYAANDTYAALLFKSGKLKKGHKQANKAIAVAIENNEDYAETTALILKFTGK